MATGIPNQLIKCKECGVMRAKPRRQMCQRCFALSKRVYEFTAYHDQRLRDLYAKAKSKQQLSRGLKEMEALGFSRTVLSHRTRVLGLIFMVRKPWTPAEDLYLLNNAGSVSLRQMAKVLKRSEFSLQCRMKKKSISFRMERDGFTMLELAETLGTSELRVSTWVKQGVLQYGGGCISHDSVAEFVAANLHLIPLKRVDEDWFKEVITGLMRKRPEAAPKPKPEPIELTLPESKLQLEPGPVFKVGVRSVQELVAKAYSLSVEFLLQRDNSPRVVEPRQVAMYLASQVLGVSMSEIGRQFGKHHTTVMHSVRKVEADRKVDKNLDAKVSAFTDVIRERLESKPLTQEQRTTYPWSILERAS
jgi:phage regulator Rha-like protein